MTKGIRAFVNDKFVATLPRLTELGNIAFRREVMNAAIMEFGISVASAATHYNHAFKTAKELTPAAVAGLGRAEDKKGGRKPTLFTVIKVKDNSVVAEGLTKADAEAMIAKAASAKKAKLAILVVVNVAAPAVEAADETEHVEGVNVEFLTSGAMPAEAVAA